MWGSGVVLSKRIMSSEEYVEREEESVTSLGFQAVFEIKE